MNAVTIIRTSATIIIAYLAYAMLWETGVAAALAALVK